MGIIRNVQLRLTHLQPNLHQVEVLVRPLNHVQRAMQSVILKGTIKTILMQTMHAGMDKHTS